MVTVATVLAFHAHPDDEVLLTGSTLAGLAAEGNRVVVVMATDGVMGAATGPGGGRRLEELRASAAVLAWPGLCIWAHRWFMGLSATTNLTTGPR
ncbi:MAG: hypothetical protein QOJ73_5003 [Streptosporangiaceae bacterium]|jgi:LmbE family N-acetylglucosaminyl deacetylase|nr:hypothetical protein [Streptosporangiaceae bacterium]